MAGPRIPTSIAASGRQIAVGFGLGSLAIVIVLALWPHSGVSGTISAPVCTPYVGNVQHCSLEHVPASISVNRAAFDLPYNPAEQGSWQIKTDARGHFNLDLPPGGYYLFAQGEGSHQLSTSFPVFSGQVTHLDLLMMRAISGGICLASGDRIATPTGSVLVAQLRPGMIVWTLDAAGRRVAAPVLLVSHIRTPPGYFVLRLRLSDGRVVEASAGHPTVTGQPIGELRPGDLLDGSRLSTVERLPYAGDTWDLLPAGATGAYWANDILVGSTLGLTSAPARSVSR